MRKKTRLLPQGAQAVGVVELSEEEKD